MIENVNNNSLKARIVFADGSTIDKINKLVFYGGSNKSDAIQIGSTTMAYFEASIETDRLLTNEEVTLECGATLTDGTEEYIPIGKFTFQKPVGDIDGVEVVANDRMQRFERVYSSSLTYPTTSAEVLNELCTICGVTLATPIENPIEITDKLDGYTCREVLGFISALHGKFACIDRFGQLNVRWYSDSPITKETRVIWSFTKAEHNTTIDKVEIHKNTEVSYTSGSGFNVLFNSNPYATQESTDNVFNSINGFAYNASKIELVDDIRLDCWDVINVPYLDGNEYLVPCMALTQDFSNGSTIIQAFSKSEVENEYNYTGAISNYIERVAYELLLANRVIATKVDAEYVNSHAITTENFEAKIAEITHLVVQEIDGKYATIDFANIDIANINKANIGLLFAEVGLIDRATIVDGHITGFLDAVEINANKITAGTLVADRILLSGEEGSVLFALNNLGELVSTNVDTLDGYVLTDRTITADKIIAKSITSNEIDVAQLFADEAAIRTLVAQSIFTDAIETNRVVVGKANRDEIVAENLLEFPYYNNTMTSNGITFTVNADGTVKANGTASAAANFIFTHRIDNKVILPKGTYTVSGCPSGGGSNSYYLQIAKTLNNSFHLIGADTGKGFTFTLEEETDILIAIYIASGATVTNLIFKPMLELGSVAHPYREYKKGGTGIANNLYYQGTTLIDGNKIYTGTVTADAIATDAIKSKNYVADTSGSFLNLADGSFDSKYLKWNNQGELTATKGYIGNWEIKDQSLLSITDKGGSYDTEWSALSVRGTLLDIITQSTSLTEMSLYIREKNTSNGSESYARYHRLGIDTYYGDSDYAYPLVYESKSELGVGVGYGITKVKSNDGLASSSDVCANYGLDTEVSLLGLKEKVDYLQPQAYSLARTAELGTLTTTQTTYNTYSGRKFSDYGLLLITIGASTSDVRASLEIPSSVFISGDGISPMTVWIDCWSNSGNTFNHVAVKYVSDTSFVAYLGTSGTVAKYLNIYGIKVDASSSGRSVDGIY